MSLRHTRRADRADRRLCADCRARKAKYRYRGHVRADRQHVLCFRCFRAARERMRALELGRLPFEGPDLSAPARLGPAAPGEPLSASARPGSSASAASLSDRQIAHRRRMLAHLQTAEG